jgi:hypothetical protein
MANFSKYLIYIISPDGTKIPFPNKYIKYDTYKYTKSVQDLDSYRDANGVLHRTALAHRIIKAEWNSPPLHLADYQAMVSLIESNYIVETERKLNVNYYDINSDKYVQGYVYVPDFTPQIYGVEESRNDIVVNEVRFAIIEY